MKKYHTSFPCYGQSIAGQIAYYEKMGVAQGIISRILNSRNLKIKDLPDSPIQIIIPTPETIEQCLDFPTFEYYGKRGYIDMIDIQDELCFHIMFYNRTYDSFINGLWHSVREGLNLEDTCTLFEYVVDRLDDLIILSPEYIGKYNETGALGVS